MTLNPLSLIGDLIDNVGGYFRDGQKIKAAVNTRKAELNEIKVKAKIQTAVSSLESDMKMDEGARKNAGWMDDVSFFVFLIPAILAFFPMFVDDVKAGFTVLEAMPKWYQYALGMMLVSVWGYRKLVSPIIQSIAKAYLGK